MRFVLLLAIWFSGLTSMIAQDSLGILDNYMKTFQKENNYKVDLSYKVYRVNEAKKKLEESASGYRMYSDYGMKEKIGDIENVAGEDFYVQINHLEHLLFFSNTKINYKGAAGFNADKLLPFFDIQPVALVDNGRTFQLTFQQKTAISSSPYTKINLLIDVATLRLKKQIFYRAKGISNINQKLEVELLEISYFNYDFFDKTTITQSDFDPKSYIKKDNSTVSLLPKYDSYRLIVQQ